MCMLYLHFRLTKAEGLYCCHHKPKLSRLNEDPSLGYTSQPMVCCNRDMVFGIQAFALEPMWTRLPSAHEALCRHTLAEFVLFCYQQQCSEDHRDLKWSGSCCTISHLARNMSNPLTNNQISAA